jgi:hypothetical protein
MFHYCNSTYQINYTISGLKLYGAVMISDRSGEMIFVDERSAGELVQIDLRGLVRLISGPIIPGKGKQQADKHANDVLHSAQLKAANILLHFSNDE